MSEPLQLPVTNDTSAYETYTLCGVCPCNSNQEYDDCKLGFNQMANVKINGDYPIVSPNCGLTVIVWLGGEFRPTTIERLLR